MYVKVIWIANESVIVVSCEKNTQWARTKTAYDSSLYIYIYNPNIVKKSTK